MTLCGRVLPFAVFAVASVAILLAAVPDRTLHLKLRTRVEAFKGSGEWREITFDQALPTSQTALILCDMWDHHWCKGAEGRVGILAQKMAPVIDLLRANGILIIHAPSETMNYYKDASQRLAILKLTPVNPPAPLALTEPPLPVDSSDGGCETNPQPENFRAWTREIATIHIAPSDLISDNGAEVYTALQLRGIKNLLIAGVHTNMCILNRSFAIRQMTRWGVRCILIRDLTDAMYNPAKPPFVSHVRGTEMVIEHIEKYWAPTVTSNELVRALKEN